MGDSILEEVKLSHVNTLKTLHLIQAKFDVYNNQIDNPKSYTQNLAQAQKEVLYGLNSLMDHFTKSALKIQDAFQAQNHAISKLGLELSINSLTFDLQIAQLHTSKLKPAFLVNPSRAPIRIDIGANNLKDDLECLDIQKYDHVGTMPKIPQRSDNPYHLKFSMKNGEGSLTKLSTQSYSAGLQSVSSTPPASELAALVKKNSKFSSREKASFTSNSLKKSLDEIGPLRLDTSMDKIQSNDLAKGVPPPPIKCETLDKSNSFPVLSACGPSPPPPPPLPTATMLTSCIGSSSLINGSEVSFRAPKNAKNNEGALLGSSLSLKGNIMDAIKGGVALKSIRKASLDQLDKRSLSEDPVSFIEQLRRKQQERLDIPLKISRSKSLKSTSSSKLTTTETAITLDLTGFLPRTRIPPTSTRSKNTSQSSITAVAADTLQTSSESTGSKQSIEDFTSSAIRSKWKKLESDNKSTAAPPSPRISDEKSKNSACASPIINSRPLFPMDSIPIVESKNPVLCEDAEEQDAFEEEEVELISVIALASYEATEEGQLSLTKGEQLFVSDWEYGNGWSFGENLQGESGAFPQTYVKVNN